MTEDIKVTNEKHIQTFRQVIKPTTQDGVPELIGQLLPLAKKQRVNGSICIVLAQGGVRNVVVENVEAVDKK